MTDLASFGLAQLTQILSTLENGRRNPNSKQTSIRAIAGHRRTSCYASCAPRSAGPSRGGRLRESGRGGRAPTLNRPG